MHMFDKEHNMLGGYGIVGGHIPLAAGVAFAASIAPTGGSRCASSERAP